MYVCGRAASLNASESAQGTERRNERSGGMRTSSAKVHGRCTPVGSNLAGIGGGVLATCDHEHTCYGLERAPRSHRRLNLREERASRSHRQLSTMSRNCSPSTMSSGPNGAAMPTENGTPEANFKGIGECGSNHPPGFIVHATVDSDIRQQPPCPSSTPHSQCAKVQDIQGWW